MEDGARDHAAVIRRDAVEGVRPHGVDLHVGRHHALGQPGRAGRVHDGLRIPGLNGRLGGQQVRGRVARLVHQRLERHAGRWLGRIERHPAIAFARQQHMTQRPRRQFP
ncbi:hypothetical protein D3C73_1169420 [compost metagenome]